MLISFALIRLVVISFVITLNFSISRTAKVNWCDNDDTGRNWTSKNALLISRISAWRKFDQSTCYFYIRDASNETNLETIDGKYVFNIGKARQICAKYESTLPTIRDETEHDFLSVFAWQHDSVYVPLGLTTVEGQNKIKSWDDDLHSNYNPDWWWSFGNATTDRDVYVVMYMDHFIWMKRGHDSQLWRPVSLFCKQNVSLNLVFTTASPSFESTATSQSKLRYLIDNPRGEASSINASPIITRITVMIAIIVATI